LVWVGKKTTEIGMNVVEGLAIKGKVAGPKEDTDKEEVRRA